MHYVNPDGTTRPVLPIDWDRETDGPCRHRIRETHEDIVCRVCGANLDTVPPDDAFGLAAIVTAILALFLLLEYMRP